MLALAALLVGFGFLEEWERLGDSGSSHSAWATFNFRNAIRILADELALRFRAVRPVTFPVASGLLADGLTFGFRSLAVSNAMRLFANCHTLGAVEHFTAFIGALNFTFRFFTLHIANCVLGFSATGVAFRGLAYGIANGRAMRVITFPGALGMALKS